MSLRTKKFLSGDEAFAEGVRLARVQVISAYPITPQTIVVEELSKMVENKRLESEFIHVESEHSALSCAIGASSVGARTFTATSSQGLLYMAECLPYASGGRFPIVMMNANRSTALPWNIYGDQRDSISQLDSGWIQIYVENAQEALDMALQSYYIAEHKEVNVPVMVNLDGFILTHTYEPVEIPTEEEADQFLPPFSTTNKMDLDNPTNMGYTVGPALNMEFHLKHHQAMERSLAVLKEADKRYQAITKRGYGGAIDTYQVEDADVILIVVGSIAGLARMAVDQLREEGIRAGVVRLRMLRPFPKQDLAQAVKNAKAVGTLDKDLSFGAEGTVYTNVNSSLYQGGIRIPSINFIGGLGGRDITIDQLKDCFRTLFKGEQEESVQYIGLCVKEGKV